MANTSLNRPWSSFPFMPGKPEPNMLVKLNIPEIDITGFRSYQYRTKAWRVEGYNTSRITNNGKSRKRREYRLNINGFKAWKIVFRNKHQVPVDITMHFTMHGSYDLVHDYTQTCFNILPGQEAKVCVIPGLKTARIKLNKVDVHAGPDLLSSTEVNSFMPFRKGSFAYSFYTSCIIGIYFLLISSNNKEIPVNNSAAMWVSVLAFYLAFWEAFNITPVIIMFLLLLIAPFILHDPIQVVSLIVFGCFYLWSVWRKRSSIKDFLIGAFIP